MRTIDDMEFFIDPNRCIGCQSCVAACSECDTHRGHSMIHLQKLQPFLLGFTMFFWATATWWIPMLLILGFWRHVYKRFPLTYHPLYWGAVFPLGMYTVCTFRLAAVANAPFLSFLPRAFVFIALAAWTATFLGLVRHLIGTRVPCSPS